MAKKNEPIALISTVSRVIEEFTAAMRADDSIDNDVIDRLEQRLRQGSIPKVDDIKATLFPPPPEAGS
jgi:hypothetical protein